MVEDRFGTTCEEVPRGARMAPNGWLLTSSEERRPRGKVSAASVVSLRLPKVHARHIFGCRKVPTCVCETEL
jgi:hypothetical protein